MKFSIKDFFSKCEQIRSFLRICLHFTASCGFAYISVFDVSVLKCFTILISVKISFDEFIIKHHLFCLEKTIFKALHKNEVFH